MAKSASSAARAPIQLSPKRFREMVSLGLQLADENKRVSRRLASLRKAKDAQAAPGKRPR